jgi:hypothetical protein
MKILWICIYIVCLIIYIYSAYMTMVEPNNNLWGFICTIIFGFVAITGTIQYIRYQREHNEK